MQSRPRIDASNMSFSEFRELFRGMSVEQAYREAGLDINQALSMLGSSVSGAHDTRNVM